MAELKDILKKDLTVALRAHDELKKTTIRMALAAIRNEEVAGKTARELTHAEELKIVAKEVAKRKDAADAYLAAGRQELADKELAEAEVLQPYLPQPLSAAELQELIDNAIAEVKADLGRELCAKDLGQIMKLANAKASGRADGKAIVALVRAKIS